jgi:hypothetical protein
MAAGLLKKNAAWGINWPITVRRWNMIVSNITPRFRDGKQKIIFAMTTL